MIITILRWYFKILLRLYYREIVIEGIEKINPEKPQLLIANHQNSLVDGLLFITQIDRDVILTTTSNLKKFPLASKILKRANVQIFHRRSDSIDHTKRRKNSNTIDLTADLLAENNHVLIFPEGFTTTDGRMLPFKTGFGRIVESYIERYDQELEIVPIYINYTDRRKIRSEVTVEILDPISSKYLEEHQTDNFVIKTVDYVREILLDVEERKIHESDEDAPESYRYLDRVLAFPFLLFHLVPTAITIFLADKFNKTAETQASLRVFGSFLIFPLIYFFQIIFLISFLPLLWVYFLISYIVIYTYQYTKTIVQRLRSDDADEKKSNAKKNEASFESSNEDKNQKSEIMEISTNTE